MLIHYGNQTFDFFYYVNADNTFILNYMKCVVFWKQHSSSISQDALII